MNKAVFLDRDGTINIDKGYVYKPEDFEFMPGAPEGIKLLNDIGFKVIVISNQSGIARKLYTSEDVHRLHKHIDNELGIFGAKIDAYYFCPHHPDFDIVCECRKPNIGLIKQAVIDYNIDINESWMVGDKASDIECANNAGLKSVQIDLKMNELTLFKFSKMFKCKHIYAFAKNLLKNYC